MTKNGHPLGTNTATLASTLSAIHWRGGSGGTDGSGEDGYDTAFFGKCKPQLADSYRCIGCSLPTSPGMGVLNNPSCRENTTVTRFAPSLPCPLAYLSLKGHVGGDGWGSANGMRAITRPHQHGFGYFEQVNLFFPVNKLLNE